MVMQFLRQSSASFPFFIGLHREGPPFTFHKQVKFAKILISPAISYAKKHMGILLVFLSTLIRTIGYIGIAFEFVLADSQCLNWIGWAMCGLFFILLLIWDSYGEGESDDTADTNSLLRNAHKSLVWPPSCLGGLSGSTSKAINTHPTLHHIERLPDA